MLFFVCVAHNRSFHRKLFCTIFKTCNMDAVEDIPPRHENYFFMIFFSGGGNFKIIMRIFFGGSEDTKCAYRFFFPSSRQPGKYILARKRFIYNMNIYNYDGFWYNTASLYIRTEISHCSRPHIWHSLIFDANNQTLSITIMRFIFSCGAFSI